MSKKFIKKTAALLLAVVMLFGAAVLPTVANPAEVQAASKKVKTLKFKKKGYVISKKGRWMNVYTRLTFSPKKSKTKKLTYKSSNKKIATISKNGILRAKKNGTVTITVIAKNNKKAKATTRVTVGKTVSKLKFKEGTKKTLKATKTLQLHPTYSPKTASTKSVTYKSSNTKVAKVTSKGKITAVGAGTATITATCKDAKSKTAKIKITVPNYVTKVTTTSALTMTKGDAAKTLTASISGGAAKVTYKWTSSNTKVVSVKGSGNKASITPIAKGIAIITVEAYNSNNTSKNHAKATCKVTINPKYGYEKVTSKDENGLTTFTGLIAGQYKVTKGADVVEFQADDVDKILKYFDDPAGAFNRWKSIETYTFADVIVSGEKNVEKKTVKVQRASSEYNGRVFEVKVKEIIKNQKYEVNITEEDKVHEYTITKLGNSLILENNTSEIRGMITKESNGTYNISVPANKAAGLIIEKYTEL